jgi:hypothetical protein
LGSNPVWSISHGVHGHCFGLDIRGHATTDGRLRRTGISLLCMSILSLYIRGLALRAASLSALYSLARALASMHLFPSLAV